MKLLYEYMNWGYKIKLYEDWTKHITWDWIPDYPVSMDVKITNYCNAWCGFCHENSTINGKHWNILKYIDLLSELPNGTELAIWGWNPLSHPDLLDFLRELKSKKLVCNLTINSIHLNDIKIIDLLYENLIYGLWVSYNPLYKKAIKNITYEHMIVHMIAWIHTFSEIKEMLESWKKVLILWYKKWWRWIAVYNEIIEKNIKEIYINLNKLFGIWLISFDNLWVEQLKPDRFFTKETWDKRYMWDDWTFTMYMDLIEEKYWINSVAPIRYNIEWTMKDIFQNILVNNK